MFSNGKNENVLPAIHNLYTQTGLLLGVSLVGRGKTVEGALGVFVVERFKHESPPFSTVSNSPATGISRHLSNPPMAEGRESKRKRPDLFGWGDGELERGDCAPGVPGASGGGESFRITVVWSGAQSQQGGEAAGGGDLGSQGRGQAAEPHGHLRGLRQDHEAGGRPREGAGQARGRAHRAVRRALSPPPPRHLPPSRGPASGAVLLLVQ